MTAFTVDQRVRVRATATVGHCRVPCYAKGQCGVIERVLHLFVIPEDEAWGRPGGRREMLYRVRMAQSAVWPGYRGNPLDTLELEVFEHWLEPAEKDTP
jgi:nitrile hydratase subunit beta